MSAFAAQFNAALTKAMSRSEAASKAGKASAAARKARAGGGSGQTTDFNAANAKANALIAASPGKYGPKGAKGKAKGKGAKPKAAKDPAAAKAKAEKEQQAAQEHAQSRAEHEQDRAQRQSDRTERQKEHVQAQSEHAADRAAKAQAQAKREKQQAQKQKQQAKQKASKEKPSAAPKAAAPVAPPEAAAAASALSSGGQLTPAQSQSLVTNGLAKPQKDGSLVLTSTGLKAAQQQTAKAYIAEILTGAGYAMIDPATAPLAKAFVPVSAWHGWASITKVDEEQRVVYGDASTETPDAQPGIWKGEAYAGDIIAMDAIAAALPDFMQWANLREMHQPSAAGVVIDASVEGSRFPIAAHVTDDQAWRKVTSGTYKGFSIGGQCQDAEIIKIEGRPFRRITKLSLTEISLVDRPANPQARITLYKGDAMDPEQDATEVADAQIAKAADPTKAIALLQQLRNDAETSGDMDAADEYTAAIRSVAQAAGIATTEADDADTTDAADMADDSALAMDDTGAADDVMMAIKAGDLRKAFPNHSDDDLIDLLLKRGAAISGTTMGHLKGAHDSLQKATGGAVCAQPGQPAAIAQAAMLAPDDLAKALAPPFEGIRKLLEQNGLEVKGLLKRLDTLERQPAPGAPNARLVPMEKSLPGDVPLATADPATVELEVLKKQRESATEPAIQRWLGERITQLEISGIYKAAR